jgi:hypothetical protein
MMHADNAGDRVRVREHALSPFSEDADNDAGMRLCLHFVFGEV